MGFPPKPHSLCVDSWGKPKESSAPFSWRTLVLVNVVQSLLQMALLPLLLCSSSSYQKLISVIKGKMLYFKLFSVKGWIIGFFAQDGQALWPGSQDRSGYSSDFPEGIALNSEGTGGSPNRT